MTEDEAKTKWCPFTRAWALNSGATNRRPGETHNCMGSGCMAWRLERNISDEVIGGYCGLVGEPVA